MINRASIHTKISQDESTIVASGKRKRGTAEELIGLVNERNDIDGDEIVEHIHSLQSEGRLILNKGRVGLPTRLVGYALSRQALWYWITTILVIVAAASVLTIPEDSFPLAYARYLLGSLFVLFLPGYSFIKALFPEEVPLKKESKKRDGIERIALSIGMSMALVLITGLLLSYSPWGIRTTPMILALLALTFFFSTAAMIRENKLEVESSA